MQTPCPFTTRRDWLRTTLLAALTGAALLASSGASAQDWPTRPVRIVVGFAAGSSGDLLARMMAPRLEAIWKQPVVIENKPGAGGIVGTEFVARATDGHTFLMGSLSSLLPKYSTKGLRYDPLTDIVPVYRVVNYQFVIVTNAKTAEKARTLQDIAALSRSTPQGLFFAGSGSTSIFNLTMEVLSKPLGIRYSSVDYNNMGGMNMAVMQNDAQLMVNAPGAIKGQLDSGDLRALAAVSAERYPGLPNVPTVFEAGYKGYLPLSWAGIFAPKGTPAAVVDRIGRDISAIFDDVEFKKAVESRLTATVLRSSPAAFAKEYRDDAAAWERVFESLSIKPQ